MGMDLYCPECGENLGKATQLGTEVGCGTCGAEFDNPDGDDDDMEVIEDE